MNKVILIGRLTKDVELVYVQSQEANLAKVKFTLAVDRKYKKGAENSADFINCIAWNKTAEYLGAHATKGSKIAVEGSIQTGSYTNKDGKKVYTTDVVVDSVEIAGTRPEQIEDLISSTPTPKEEYMDISALDEEELPFK